MNLQSYTFGTNIVITPFKSLKPLTLLAASLFIGVVAGAGGYWLGIRTGQKSEIISQPAPIATTTPTTTVIATPTPTVSLTTAPVLPTQIPLLTANWKTYINARLGLSFKYPETWFPQEVPNCCPPGATIKFYLGKWAKVMSFHSTNYL